MSPTKKEFPKFSKYYGVYRASCFRCTNFSLVRADDFYLCSECGYFSDKTKLLMDTAPCTYFEAVKHHLKYQQVLNKFIDLCHDNLLNKSFEALDYLISTRKVSLETIKRYKLGYVDSYDSNILSLVNEKRDCFNELKYLNKYGNLNCRDNLLFPVFSLLDGLSIGYASRSFREKRFSHSPNNIIYDKKKVLYGLPSQRFYKPAEEVFIVEGTFDVYAMEKIDCGPCYALIGGKNSQGLIALYRNGVKTLNIASDGDLAGDQIFENIKRYWNQHFNIKRFEIPRDMDPDKFVNGI